MKCKNCETNTQNPKFCSRSCSASHNNRKFPKRKAKTYICKTCNNPIQNFKDYKKRSYCSKKCLPNYVDWTKITIATMRGKRRYQKHSAIRTLARKTFMASDRPKHCENCGYSKHIEVCHIKDLSEFSPDTYISEVNSQSNLIGLCRNCHWEFDNGLLSL